MLGWMWCGWTLGAYVCVTASHETSDRPLVNLGKQSFPNSEWRWIVSKERRHPGKDTSLQLLKQHTPLRWSCISDNDLFETLRWSLQHYTVRECALSWNQCDFYSRHSRLLPLFSTNPPPSFWFGSTIQYIATSLPSQLNSRSYLQADTIIVLVSFSQFRLSRSATKH